MKKIKRRAGRAGITLIETTVVMIVASAALAVGAGMYSDYLNNLTNRAAANQMKEVTDAFSRYMDDNHLTLRTQVPGVGSRTTVSFSDLQSGGYLPAAFENRTPYNHEYVLTVRRPGAGNSLQGLVHTTYSDSSFAIEPKHALEISRMVGVSGGYTGEIDPQDVISTYGNYDLDLATFNLNPGPGVLVSAIAVDHATQPGEKYLHRSETGDPDHNRMNTSIDMSDNNLNNAHTVRTRSLYASELVDAQRLEADVGDITTLSATTGNINTLTSTLGTINTLNTTTGNITDVRAGSIQSTGSIVGATGSFSTLSANSLTATHTNAGGLTASSSVVNGNSTVTGTMRSNGRLTAGEYIQVNGVAVENGGCPSNGLIGRNTAGLALSCQSGVWKKVGNDRLTDMASCTTRSVNHGGTHGTLFAGPSGIVRSFRTKYDYCIDTYANYTCIGASWIFTGETYTNKSGFECIGGN